MKFASAKTQLDSFLSLEAWVKLKATLVLPLRSGKQRRRISRKFHEQQMLMWIAGEQEEFWKIALEIERQRKMIISKALKRKAQPAEKPKSGEKDNNFDHVDKPLSKE